MAENTILYPSLEQTSELTDSIIRRLLKNLYIQDGLVAWWDGEWNAGFGVHDATATVWKDLTDTYKMTATAATDTWDSNCLQMGTTIWNLTPKTQFIHLLNSPQRVGESYTIEMVLSHPNNGKKNIFGQIYTVLDIHTDGFSEVVWLKSGTDIRISLTSEKIHSISLSGERVGNTANQKTTWRYNGGNTQSVTRAYTTASDTQSNPLGLGCGHYTAYGIATARIYCIRLYNRQLTNEEVAFNYATDKRRFNLP